MRALVGVALAALACGTTTADPFAGSVGGESAGGQSGSAGAPVSASGAGGATGGSAHAGGSAGVPVAPTGGSAGEPAGGAGMGGIDAGQGGATGGVSGAPAGGVGGAAGEGGAGGVSVGGAPVGGSAGNGGAPVVDAGPCTCSVVGECCDGCHPLPEDTPCDLQLQDASCAGALSGVCYGHQTQIVENWRARQCDDFSAACEGNLNNQPLVTRACDAGTYCIDPGNGATAYCGACPF